MLKNKTRLLNIIKERNYKNLNSSTFLNNKNFIKCDNLVMYIIDICFFRTNILLHIMDFSGTLKFFCSAGDLFYVGKSKKARVLVLKSIFNMITLKLKFLQNKPIAVHATNAKSALYNNNIYDDNAQIKKAWENILESQIKKT